MTNKEIQLTINILDKASDDMGNAGSNDVDEFWLKDFTQDELRQMDKEFNDLNGTPEHHDPNRIQPLPDFCYLALMKDKLKRMMK